MSTATAVRERPIIFSGPMIRAILEGRKTQTRRVIKPQPENPETFGMIPRWGSCTPSVDTPGVRLGAIPAACVGRYTIHAATNEDGRRVDRWIPCPYGAVGSLWCIFAVGDDGNLYDVSKPDAPPRNLPAWASRLTLELTEIRVQRLNEISTEDAVAEGVRCEHGYHYCTRGCGDPVQILSRSWDELNAKRGHPWASNPWVWALTFRRIDTPKE